MERWLVLRNDEWTDTTCVHEDAATAADYKAYDGTKKKLVKVIEARTQEIAFALFDQWQEREIEERPHKSGCFNEGAPCWCS